MRPIFRSLLVLGVLAGAVGCTSKEGSSPTAAAPSPAPESGPVVAEVGGAPITQDQLDAWIKEDWFREQTEGKNPAALFDLRSGALERMIDERLVDTEAKKQGLTSDQLMAAETGKGVTVADDAVRKFYDDNQARMGGQTFEQIGPRIRTYLEQQGKQEAWRKYVQGLREAANVSVKLEQPRVQVAAEGASRGPADAPVTIIEFSDYQCPFCRKAEPTVKEVLARYPDKVRFVYRHFPLEMHPRARPAAEASNCAGEQGKFWEYHDQVFAGGALEDADLERYAKASGLDVAAWKKCLADGTTKARVDADFAAGRAAGVTGTPAFFVNGLMISGAQPVDEFVRRIEAELKRTAGGGAASGG